MSLILDALKKLEQDKAARRDRHSPLRPALVGMKGPAPVPRWRLPLLVAVAVCLAVAVTVSVMERRPGKEPAPSSPATVASSESPRADSGPASPLTNAVAPPSVPVAAPFPQAAPVRPVPPAAPVMSATPEPVMSAPADIKVTGIAWQDDRSARRAVVNGTLVGEGAVVAGARVVEIRQEQVRFAKDGGRFTIAITSANR